MLLTTLIATVSMASPAAPALPYGERRGIQALYFAYFPPTYVKSICEALDTAPDQKKLEIAMCPYFAELGKEWLNVNAAIEWLKDRELYITIHFGHHSLADDDYTLSEWADSFYENVFSSNHGRAKFCISLANEDKYNDRDWKRKMGQFLKQLKSDWDADHETDGKKFPVRRLIVRRNTLTGSNPSSKFVTAEFPKGIPTESEYHFPDNGDQSSLKTGGYSVFSNDGQVVYDEEQHEGSGLAKDKNLKTLAAMSMRSFKKKWGAQRLLLWHPQFHLWPLFDGVFYYKKPRQLPDDSLQRHMVEVIKDFVRN